MSGSQDGSPVDGVRSGDSADRRDRQRPWLIAAAVIALSVGIAFGSSRIASGAPDGLERVAADLGIDRAVEARVAAEATASDRAGSPRPSSPLADYRVEALDDENLAVGLAGAMGVVVTVAAACVVVIVVNRRVVARA